jgi:hypothetical protein
VRSAMLRKTLSALSLSCFAQKAGDLPLWQIPPDVYVSHRFFTPKKPTSVRAMFERSAHSSASVARRPKVALAEDVSSVARLIGVAGELLVGDEAAIAFEFVWRQECGRG